MDNTTNSLFDEPTWFEHCLADVKSSAEFAFVDLAGRPVVTGGQGPAEIPVRIGNRAPADGAAGRENGTPDHDRAAIHDWHARSYAGARGRLTVIERGDLLRGAGVWLIQGGAGSGKTMLLRSIARQQADEGVLALLVPASDFARWHSEGGQGRSLLAYWAEGCADRVIDRIRGVPAEAQDRRLLQEAARRWLGEGRAFWVLDGLDEIARAHRTERLQAHLANEAALPRVRFLLSARFGGATDVLTVAPERELEVLPLEMAESERFLEWHLGPQAGAELARQLAADVTVSRLVPNPLFLSLAALAYRDGGFTLPTGLGLLLDRAVGAMLCQGAHGPIPKGLTAQGVDAGRLRAVAEYIAWSWFLAEHGRDLERRDVLDHVEAAAKAAGCAAANREDLLDYLSETRLLSQRGDRMVQFVHLAIQEFLAACHLMDSRSGLSWEAWLHSQVWRREWSLVVQFAASRIRESARLSAFLDVLLDPSDLPGGQKDDILATRACMASAGLALVSPDTPGWQDGAERIDLALLDRLGGSAGVGGAHRSGVLATVDTPLPWHYAAVGGSGMAHRLVRTLRSPNAHFVARGEASEALAGAKDPGVLAALIGAVVDPAACEEAHWYAASALVGTKDARVLADMTEAVMDPAAAQLVREVAALSLRGTEDPRSLAALAAVVRDPAVATDIRWRAAESLEGTQDASAQAALAEALLDPLVDKELRWRAAKSLSGTRDSASQTALLTVLRGSAPDEEFQRAARDALCSCTLNVELVTALTAALHDPTADDGVRSAAATWFSGTEDADALSALAMVVRDVAAPEGFRWTAARALRGTRDAGVLADLVATLRDPAGDEGVRSAVACSFEGTQDAAALSALAAVVRDASAAEGVRKVAARALRGTHDTGALAALVAALRDPGAGDGVHRTAADALAGTHDAGALAAMAAVLRDDAASEVQWMSVATALGGTRDAGALTVVVSTLRDLGADAHQRRLAAWALRDTHDAGALAALVATLKDPGTDEDVRRVAATALGGTQDARAVAALSAVVRDVTAVESIRKEAAWSLRGTHDSDALAALAAVLRDSTAGDDVRRAAAYALKGKHDAGTLAALATALRNPGAGEAVREEAAKALEGTHDADALAALAASLRDTSDCVRAAGAVGIRAQSRRVVWPDGSSCAIDQFAAPQHAPEPAAGRHLVFLVHGIRTPAHWVEPMSTRLRGLGLEPINAGYGYFGLLPFLFPLVGRKRALERVRSIVTAHAIRGKAEISFITHSFGCWIVDRLVRGSAFTGYSFKSWVQCGSVLPRGRSLFTDRVARVVNICGTRDIWPGMARQLALGCGDTGSWGSRSHPVSDVWVDADHSQVVKMATIQDRLARAVVGEAVSSDPSAVKDGEPHFSIGVRLLSRLYAKCGLVVVLALLLLVLIRTLL